MRYTFRLHKLLWVLNLILLGILGYSLFNLIFKNASQEYALHSKPESTQADFGLNQSSSEAVNPQIILERNIFRPVTVAGSQKNSQTEIPLSQSAKPVVGKQLGLRLLGTVAGNDEVACAVVEDIKTRVQDLYKAGDVIQGARIEKIERNRIILLNEGVPEILNLYVASGDRTESFALAKETNKTMPGDATAAEIIKVTSPTERQVNKSAFLAKIGGIEAVMKTVEVSPHRIDGKADGLQISGLEGLSMARLAGLENGDVIQTINRQTL